MNTLKIKWQRLLINGKTCPRCKLTEKELEKAISILKQYLNPLGIEIIIEKNELSVEEFKKNSLQSNQIWVNDVPLEDWINGKVGQSICCDVCGPSECRTIKVGKKVYETIPAELVVKAGLLAALQLIK
uniref:DUF2703 domain-containing protein n=1 Tax=Thermodesulfobacterium geofontis TaxID=1295609 RepID=A0A7C4NSB4_9BACT